MRCYIIDSMAGYPYFASVCRGVIAVCVTLLWATGCSLLFSTDVSAQDAASDDAATERAAPLARYRINEAASLQEATQLIDDTPDPVHLELDYDEGSPVFDEGPIGGRHLRFEGAGSGGGLMQIAYTKLASLHGSTAATLEVKLEIDACESPLVSQRIFGVNDGYSQFVNGWFGLRASDTAGPVSVGLAVTWAGKEGWTFYYSDLCPDSLTVMHAVFDSTEPDEADRVRIYYNGQRRLVHMADGGWPPLGATIDLGDETQYVYLGRAVSGSRDSGERIYYAAVYGEALSDEVVAELAGALAADDD